MISNNVGDVGYTYEMKKYEDTNVALPNSIINTPQNLKSLQELRATLNIPSYVWEVYSQIQKM